ncbi:hypothetical protein [Pseudonocardia hierapolitana]|uniref:hypothetical protein n=1 Tax=Pseudonocardia hierapolitana TaxID=1128676 RepID=UPI0011BD7114|nr:hypothetical protein [Pseudonocardia hierapolitana]
MRFPPRLVLAASALGMVAASSGAVLLMPEPAETGAVPVPEITSPRQEQQQAPAPAEPVTAPAPAITGAQIAELALAPARDRAAALIEEQARAEAEEERAARRGDDDDRWDDLRDEIREACDDGRIRGQICRSG